MANVFTLDSLREAAQEDFADLEIPAGDRTITLLNPLRLSEAQRDEIKEFFEQLGNASEDEEEAGDEASEEGEEKSAPTMFDVITEILRRVASDKDDAEFLLNAIGDDRPLLLTVFNKWTDRTQAGEA